MRKERKIINTNIRLNLCDEQDRQAWEYLQTMDREKYKSYTRAVVVALNDYFSREYRNEEDPYLETREKEDAFLERVETAVRDGVKESVPMAIAKNLMEMLVPFVKESVGEINLPDRTLTMEKDVYKRQEYSREEMNEALRNIDNAEAQLSIRDLSGHGTAVAAIAAGNSGVASQAQLLIVKLGNPAPDSFPKTTELMMAVEYAYRKALEVQMLSLIHI